MADATPPDGQGWQQVAVDPLIVAARVAGISEGFFLFDDTGTEWRRKGEQFTESPFPNRFVHSRESGRANAPYLTVELGPEDRTPPRAPENLRIEPGDLPAGEAWVSWVSPDDVGSAGVAGFFVRANGNDVPRYLIPLAGQRGKEAKMHLRDIGPKPGAEVEVEVRAMDGAGNVGPSAKAKGRVSDRLPASLPPPRVTEGSSDGATPPPHVGVVDVAIVDELDKVLPGTLKMVPQQPRGYLARNHLWDAARKRITLYAARNEFVGFQIVLMGNPRGFLPSLSFEGSQAAKVREEFGWYHAIPSKSGSWPDPITPLADAGSASIREGGSCYCELFVPADTPPGEHKGTLTLAIGNEKLALDIVLVVWNFTLPDVLSFLPEMNCYDLSDNERSYYRLAHRHRTILNRVPYHQNGSVSAGCAPAWNGKTLEWSAWDRRFGPYFDGAAFADLPRKKVPIECFYLPIHENWPPPIEPNYNGSYWADQAFTEGYRRDLVAVARQFSEHMNNRGWTNTFFQFFLNGKNDFKRRGWSRGSSPWLLDEPAHFQDFWALRFFGAAFHEGIRQAPGRAKMVFRCDISRPQWQRDALDGLLDYNVVGGAMRKYQRMVMDRKEANGEIVIEYGSTNAIDQNNCQPVGWSIDSWALGCDGVLPWQTIGEAGSWSKADALALFYPPRNGKGSEPVPSIRLKAYRRGQQDVEYLTMLALVTHQPRWAVGQRAREALRLVAERKGTRLAEGEDAGVISYRDLRPQDLWALRVRVGQALSEAHPPARRQLVDLRPPGRGPMPTRWGYARTSAPN
jgi:hypothetical protein